VWNGEVEPVPQPHHVTFADGCGIEALGGTLLLCLGHRTYHKETDVIAVVAGQQRLDLTADDAANAGLLADGRCVVNRNTCHGLAGLETSIGPQTVCRKVPKQDNADGKEFCGIVADQEACLLPEGAHPIGFPQVVEGEKDQLI
jgi:hypothetical protein